MVLLNTDAARAVCDRARRPHRPAADRAGRGRDARRGRGRARGDRAGRRRSRLDRPLSATRPAPRPPRSRPRSRPDLERGELRRRRVTEPEAGQGGTGERDRGADAEREIEAVGERVRRTRGGVGARLRVGDRREHREPERPAHQPRGVQQARADAALLGRQRLHRDDRRRHQREAHADRRQQRAREARCRSRSRPGRCRRAAASRRVASSMPPVITRRGPSRPTSRGASVEATKIESVIGRKRQPGLDRVVAEHFLHVEGQEEPHREEDGVEQRDDEVRDPQLGVAQDRERDQRLRSRSAPRRARRRRAARNPTASGTSTPAEPQPSVSVRTIPNVRLTRLAVISTAPATSKLRVPRTSRPAGIRRMPERDHDDAERHVDGEDRGPAEGLREHAAEQRARGGAERAHRAPHADRAVALGTGLERARDDRQRGRREHRAAEALQRPRAQQQRPSCPPARTRARRARTARSRR